ncbi:hypothetical protein DSO57_1026296 [Entomophthora muscae]|uniref:Uncharacterized protein n=1 Tax=Entomophthora muscae TaxID=34485 RepID=A0ACC2T2J5_9FUNG|nr:hypothetical protein DSO57_1026296 [Entomophthora muscae]
MIPTILIAILPSVTLGVPVFHTVNHFDLSGHVCPLQMVRGLSCPTLCVKDVSMCPVTSSKCPLGKKYCSDGKCKHDCSGSANICACGAAEGEYMPCFVSLKVNVKEFNATLKVQQINTACGDGLGLDPSIPTQPDAIDDGLEMYWGKCPARVPQSFTFREPMWLSVFATLTFEVALLLVWLGYKRIRERDVARMLARDVPQGGPSEKSSDCWSEDEGLFAIKGFRNDPLGVLAKMSVVLVSIGLAVFLGVITADYYGAVTGQEFGIAHENYDASSKMFIGVWVTSVIWFVGLVLVGPRLGNWFRLECSPPDAGFIQIEQAMAPMVLLDVEDSALSQRIRTCEAKLRRLVGWDLVITSTPLLHTSSGRCFFNYRCVRYVQDGECFLPFTFSLATTCHQFRLLGDGLTSKEAALRLELKGPNFISVQVPRFITALMLEFTGFFYLYQLLILWLFFYFAYYQIGLVDTALIITSALIRVVMRQRAQRRLKQMAEHRSQVCTLRDGTWVAVSTEEIVPGDVFKLVRGISLPCDAVLIEGDAVIDESSLTGEPLPVRKSCLRDESGAYDRIGLHKPSTLFQGTQVATENEAVALAHRTAADTDRGELMRRMLYPSPVSFIFDVQLKAVVVMLGIWGIIIFILALWLMQKGGTSAWFYAMFGFAQVLSPLLPAALVVGQSVSAGELRKRDIFCVDLSRIVMAGKVRIFCFDKTGTLTKEGLDFLGVRATNSKGLLPLKSPQELAPLLELGVASCHGVSQLEGSLIGNPVDLEMFSASQWRLAPSTLEGAIDRLESPGGRTAHVIRRFDFVHARASMSVVVQDETTGHTHVYLKGSFERVAALASIRNLEIHAQAEEMSREGCYVLAMAHKDLGNVPISKVQEMSQDDIEHGIEFSGLIAFKNQLKPSTTKAIQELRAGDTRNVIITGDNALTAIYIARACNMAPKSTFLLATYENDQVLWRDADDRTYSPIAHSKVLERLRYSEDFPVELAMTGDAFNQFLYRDQIAPLLLRTRVFARMTPRDKVTCVKLHMARGITAMCGDGGNDCGALRAAHVGLALSEAEASIVSPFSTNRRTIESCVELIRQGRAALASSLPVTNSSSCMARPWLG